MDRRFEDAAVELGCRFDARGRFVMRVVKRDLLGRSARRVVRNVGAELPAGGHVHAHACSRHDAGVEAGAAEQVAYDVHAGSAGQLLYFSAEALHVISGREAVVGLLVDADDALLLKSGAAFWRTGAEERVMSAMLGEHEEEFAHTAAEREYVHGGEFFVR